MFQFVQEWVLQAGAIGVVGFLTGGVMEELLLPFPTPLIFLGAVRFIGEPLTLVLIIKMVSVVILPIVIGATIGSLIIYGICYAGGKLIIDRFSKFLRFSWDDVERVRAKLASAKSDEWVLFISRVIPFGPTKIVNAAAGVVRMNLYSFTLIVLVATFIRISLLFFGSLILGGAIFGS